MRKREILLICWVIYVISCCYIYLYIDQYTVAMRCGTITSIEDTFVREPKSTNITHIKAVDVKFSNGIESLQYPLGTYNNLEIGDELCVDNKTEKLNSFAIGSGYIGLLILTMICCIYFID